MAQNNEVLLQKLIELSGSVLSKTFSYLSHLNSQPCKILSPQCIATITLPHGSSLCYHQATSRKSPSHSPAQSQTSFHFLCHLLQTQMLTPFFSALSTPHTCHSGALPPLLCSEFGFLHSAAVYSSHVLSKRFWGTRIILYCPLPRSGPLDAFITLSACLYSFPHLSSGQL